MGALTPQEPLTEVHSIEEEADEINFNAELYHHQMELRSRLKNATPLEMGNAIFKSMVFLDLKKMAMVNPSTFSNMLLQYPTATPRRESHRIMSLRQGLSALWKHFIAPSLYDEMQHFGQEVARGFGHSAAIDLAAYGFDSARSVGPGEVPFASAKKLCQIFQRLTKFTQECKSSVEKEDTVVEKGEGSIGDYFDICQAGAQVIDGFRFRSMEQERFTVMVLTSDRSVLALQASTAFGKTLTYLLPIMVLKKSRPGKYVHFIAVPYVSVKIATIQRLQQAGLVVADLTLLTSTDLRSKLKSIDVLVGTFDMFGTHTMFSFLNGWEEVLGSMKQRGYFVIDDAHVLWLEQEFREQLRNLHSLKWKHFLKIVLLSATFPKWLFQEVCKQLNLSDFMVRNAQWMNAVDNVPNPKVIKEVTSVVPKQFGHAIEQRVNSYLLGTQAGKAIFFFNDKARMRRCYERWKNIPEVTAVDGEMSDRVKLNIFRQFESSSSPVRVIMGTKLISNGLNCSAVNYVCLADCDVHVIDFLQMVGRIRGEGYLEVVGIPGRSKRHNEEAVAHNDLRPIEWGKCFTETVGSFYSLSSQGHQLCCSSWDEENSQGEPRRLRNIVHSVWMDVVQEENEDEDVGETGQVVSSAMFDFIIMSLKNEITGLYIKELRTLLHRFTSANLPKMKDLMYGVPPSLILTRAEMDLPESVCQGCFMSLEYCQCQDFGEYMGALILEALVLCRLSPRRDNLKALVKFAQLGRGHRILNHVLHEKKLWASKYEQAADALYREGIEGIDVSADAGSEVLLRWGHFWPDVLKVKFNVVSLVLAHKVSRGFDVNREWGGRAPYTAYARSFDKEIFLQSHRRMLDIVTQTLWDEKCGRSDCSNIAEFKLLVILLYCVYEKGDVHEMVQSFLPGYRVFEVFPQWVGSLMCRTQCGYEGPIPIYRFVLGTYVGKHGLQLLLNEDYLKNGWGL